METKKKTPRVSEAHGRCCRCIAAWTYGQVVHAPRSMERSSPFTQPSPLISPGTLEFTAVVNVIFTAVNDDSPHMIASSADCAVFKGDDGWVGSPLEWVPVRVTVHVQTSPVITESASAMGGTPRNHVNRVVTSAIGEAAVREKQESFHR